MEINRNSYLLLKPSNSTIEKNLQSKIQLKKVTIKPKIKGLFNTIALSNMSKLHSISLGSQIGSSVFRKINILKSMNNDLPSNGESINKKFFNYISNKINESDMGSKKFENLIESKIHSNGIFNNIQPTKEKNIRLYDRFLKMNNIKKTKFYYNHSMNIMSNNSKLNLDNSLNDLSLDNRINKFKKNSEGAKSHHQYSSLNISSHYIGNTSDNKFGITSNKYLVNKDEILSGYTNLGFKNTSNKNKFFKILNIPLYDNNANLREYELYFNPKYNMDGEKIQKKIFEQMAVVFNNKLKNYLINQSNDMKSAYIEFNKNLDLFNKEKLRERFKNKTNLRKNKNYTYFYQNKNKKKFNENNITMLIPIVKAQFRNNFHDILKPKSNSVIFSQK